MRAPLHRLATPFPAACLIALALTTACSKKSSDPVTATPEQTSGDPLEIVVRADREDLVFTWVDGTGAFHDVTRIDDVPEEARAQVLVRDLSRTPDELRTADFLYIADLRAADATGRYPCGAVSRRLFDRRGVNEAAANVVAEKAAAGEPTVTVYTASWCGVCRKAKAFLTRRGVPFLERDVEKDEGAEAELQARALAAGLRPQGVPVIDVAGELMMGFDARALEALLEKQGF